MKKLKNTPIGKVLLAKAKQMKNTSKNKPPKNFAIYKAAMFAVDQPYAWRYADGVWTLWTNNPAHLEATARWALEAARWMRLEQCHRDAASRMKTTKPAKSKRTKR